MAAQDTASWEAVQLLNPKGSPGAVSAAKKPPKVFDAFVHRGNSAVAPPAELVFEFASQDQPTMVDNQSHGPQTSILPLRSPSMPMLSTMGGISKHLESMNGVEYRSDVPKPKRRKTQAEEDNSHGMRAGFSGARGGIAGEYMRRGREEARENNTHIATLYKHEAAVKVEPTALVSGRIFSRQNGIAVKREETKFNYENGASEEASFSVQAFELPTGANHQAVVDLTGVEPDLVMVDVKEENRSPEVDEVCYGMVAGPKINAHTVPSPKPGAYSVGGHGYWPQVKVILRRRLGEADRKVIVYDYTRKQIGLLDPVTSTALAPLLESRMGVRTDCRIPPRRKELSEAAGQSTSAQYKFDLMIYGPRKLAHRIGQYLRNHGVSLVSPARVLPGTQVLNPHVEEAKGLSSLQRLPLGMRNEMSYNAGGSGPYSRTAEEVKTTVMGMLDAMQNSDELAEDDVSNHWIVTKLLKHQRQALYFMKRRESDQLPVSEHDGMIHSTWQRKRDPAGHVFYENVITNTRLREPPPVCRGGILADMMGLGKTLSTLSLIVSTHQEAVEWSQLPPSQAHLDANQPAANAHGQQARSDLPLTRLKLNSKATLLVCPLSVITNWEEQLKQHVRSGKFKYYIYHGATRTRDPAVLAGYDLVLTTYGSVSSELTARSKRKKSGECPLEDIGWFRIVLDEAHIIREQNTLSFKAICRLQASRRWAVTGTPVQNKLEDLAALLAFLRLSPFDKKSAFTTYIVTPFKNADPEIVPKLRILIDTITLRRLKDKIDLPPRKDEFMKLQFSDDEARVYRLFQKQADDCVKSLTNQAGQTRIMGGKTYIHILRAILRLRLLCAHGQELLREDDFSVLSGLTQSNAISIDEDSDNEEDISTEAGYEVRMYTTYKLCQETGQDGCFGCGKRPSSNEEADEADIESEPQEDILGYMAPCFHIFCRMCISKTASSDCGHCHGIDKSGCVQLSRKKVEMEAAKKAASRPRSNDGAAEVGRYSGPHTKTKALVKELLELEKQSAANPDEPPYKSVVFSTWTSHLDLIMRTLDDAGIKHVRLDGKMSRTARSQATDTFRDDDSVHVILVSITAGGLGLNLTRANNVFVMEPQFNPASESQAVDRVHRLGQKRPVRIIRFIMKESFEEAMLKIQDKKKALAQLSMEKGDKKMNAAESARQRLEELRSLFR